METDPSSDNQSRPALASGELFDERYQLLEEIGRGGMAVVYKAVDRILQREVALKILNSGLVLDATQQQRFRREAQACSILQHENIVKILHSGIDSAKRPYLAMELLSGKTLEQLFNENHKLDRDQFAQVFLPVMDALEYAHSKQIIHRDLKPANIMICNPSPNVSQTGVQQQSNPSAVGLIKVLDFGIAKILESAPENPSQTFTIGLTGTPQYMSPEQVSTGKADRRSDIYSLACVMYESITGRPPFLGESALETMYEHLRSSVPKITEISSSMSISRELVEAIIMALAKDPAKRPQSMKQFEETIGAAITSENIVRSRKKIPFFSACAALTLLIAVTAFWFAAYFKTPTKPEAVILHKNMQSSDVKGLSTKSLIEQAQSLYKQGEIQRAIDTYQLAIKRAGPGNNEEKMFAIGATAHIYADRHNFEKAIEYYRMQMNLYRDDRPVSRLAAARDLGTVLVAQGRIKEADEVFMNNINAALKSLAGDPSETLAETWCCYSGVLYEQRRYKEAMKAAHESLHEFDKLPVGRTSTGSTVATWVLYDCCKESNLPMKQALDEIQHTKADLVKSEEDPDSIATQAIIKISGRHNAPKNEARREFAEKAAERGFTGDAVELYKLVIANANLLYPRDTKRVRAECQRALDEIYAKQKLHPQRNQ